jgi:hypothetical protein
MASCLPHTVDSYIEALGGTRKAAEAFGVSVEVVCNWRTYGHFPARKLLVVTHAMQRKCGARFKVPPSLFKIEEPQIAAE